jgi:hypothetical protein
MEYPAWNMGACLENADRIQALLMRVNLLGAAERD